MVQNKDSSWKDEETEKFMNFALFTAIKLFFIQIFFGLLFHSYVLKEFRMNLSLNPEFILNTSNVTLGITIIIFSLFFFPILGSELALRIGMKSDISKKKLKQDSVVVGAFIFIIDLVELKFLAIVYLIANQLNVKIISEIFGILISTTTFTAIMNFIPIGLFIWILYPKFYNLRKKIVT